GDPVGLRRVRVVYPAGKPLHWKVTRDDFQVRTGVLDGGARFVDISAREVPRVRTDSDTPPGYDAYGRIELSSADHWSDIVQWALTLYPVAFEDRATAGALARELGLHDPDKLA